jgi:FMN phosphatase YigB (HAD superfamily)
MIRGLLTDLDDTLLANDTSRFLPAYFQRLSRLFAGRSSPDEVMGVLLRSTQRMLDNRDPQRTLKEVFDDSFYPALGLEAASTQAEVQAFYREVFPELRALTSPLPGAADLVTAARALGLAIVIATNPMLPDVAVAQRLAWAELPEAPDRFELVTTYESFHFAKPDPAYVAEILGRMGWRPAESAMIGNDVADDLQPAARLGVPAFHLGGPSQDGFPSGDHAAAIVWLRADPAGRLPAQPSTPTSIEARLRGQAAALDTMTRGLSPEDWIRRPAGGGRSAVEIVCHLRDVESELTLPRLELIRHEPNPFLPAPDTGQWVVERRYAEQSGPVALRSIGHARRTLLEELTTLSPEDWSRPARHALLGPTTLAEVLSTAAEHEIVHLASLRLATARVAA